MLVVGESREASKPAILKQMGAVNNNSKMTAKQNELLKAKKWTELLMSLAVGHQHVLVFETTKDMHSCRNVGWRINRMSDSDRKFSIKADFAQKAIAVTVSQR